MEFLKSIDLPSGLTKAEVAKQRKIDGPNSLPQAENRWIGHILWSILTEPMVFLLVGCGAIYFFLGDPAEALMLLGFLVLILGITVYQEQKAENALQALRDISSPRALVVREGKKLRISGTDVVRGDIVFLNEGDRVSADLELLSTQNLMLDESLLTGESEPVTKWITPDKPSNAYSGTTVVRGFGLGKVIATGERTELGKIGKALQENEREPTHLESESRRIVKIIAIFAGVLCLVVVFSYAFLKQDWVGGILAGLTLAMGILPNELPAVLAIFLALGSWRLSKHRVLTRRSAVIEALGAATVLCVDKTGTLTENRMTVRKLWNLNGSHTFTDFETDFLPEDYHELIEYGILAGEKEPLDPMDKAFQTVGLQFLMKTEHLHPSWTLVQQYPLTSELLALTHAWKSLEEPFLPVASKGAPEAIVDLCHLDPNEQDLVFQQVKEMASAGYRVLGVARGRADETSLPELQHDLDFVFLGLVGLQDPIRKEVPLAIEQCHTAGIRVVMITGDHPDTAKSIAREIGLTHPDEVLIGAELQTLSDEELQSRLSKTSICARMVPEQKLRLIQALKAMGEVVAMTGDGVNDAPALRNAHIGIAMGKRGTDVARESASLVLLDDDFCSIVTAVRHGRRIFDNLVHTSSYLLAVHIPIASISVFPILFDLPLVLLPIHIAFLHLIIEPASSIAFEADPESSKIMSQPPRGLQESVFSSRRMIPVIGKGLATFILLFLVLLGSIWMGLGEPEARTITFASLLLSHIALLYSERGSSMGKHNPLFFWISLGSLGLLCAVIGNLTLRTLFHFSPISLMGFGIISGASILCVIVYLFLGKTRKTES